MPLEIKDLQGNQKDLMINNANEFMKLHHKHVINLIRENEYVVPPSGSDIFKPELWKGCHWNWFIDNVGKS